PIRELQNFLQFNLFNLTNPPIKHDIQSEFKDWFNDRYPSAPERKDEPNDQYSLQHAIKLVFNQWLYKELTLSNWGCGIDEHLATCIPQALVGMDRVRCLAGEREIRQLQTQYAINDCLSLTKLMFPVLYDWTPEQVENYEKSLQSLKLASLKLELQYEDISDDEDMGLIPVHVQDEPLFHSPVPVEVRDELVVHVQDGLNEPSPLQYESISDDEEDQNIVPQHNPSSMHNRLVTPQRTVRIEKRRSPDSHKQYNQLQNRRRRARRYERILRSMNIHYVNFNVVGHILFIGMKDEHSRAQLEQMLHDNMFTESHYYRLYPQ
ncbi:unnamed protein product, partial [Didymodactylos carnosus]